MTCKHTSHIELDQNPEVTERSYLRGISLGLPRSGTASKFTTQLDELEKFPQLSTKLSSLTSLLIAHATTHAVLASVAY